MSRNANRNEPVPRATDGTGGVSIVQDGGLTEGGRTVRGSVTAASLGAGQDWAMQQRVLLGVDADGNGYRVPKEMEKGYESGRGTRPTKSPRPRFR